MKKFHRNMFISRIAALSMLVSSYFLQGAIGDLSQQFTFTVMPPGRVFSVNWWLIYIGVIVMVSSRLSLRVWWNNQRDKITKTFRVSAILHLLRLVLTALTLHVWAVVTLFVLRIVLLNGIVEMSLWKDKLHLPKTTLIPWSLYLWRVTVAMALLWVSQLFFLYQGVETTNSLTFIIPLLIITTYIVSNLMIKTTRWVWVPFFIAWIWLIVQFWIGLDNILWLSVLAALIIVVIVWTVRSTRGLKTIQELS